MERVCDFNREVVCDRQECYHCGWDPEVAQERLREIQGAIPKRYKVPFTGYCEVWARNSEEAAEMAEDIEKQFFAHYDYSDPICLEKEEEDELD